MRVYVCSFVLCVRVCVHLGIHHSVTERHSCPVPSVSVVAGRQEEGTQLPHKTHITQRQLRAQSQATHRLLRHTDTTA